MAAISLLDTPEPANGNQIPMEAYTLPVGM